jgi:hypothetical protein
MYKKGEKGKVVLGRSRLREKEREGGVGEKRLPGRGGGDRDRRGIEDRKEERAGDRNVPPRASRG